jgi:glycosyltransferase involved in cell wall biosynthesis
MFKKNSFLKRLSLPAQKPLISTVLLNWNRENLLRRTIESYLATVSVPYELIIVDNASEDGSRDYIRSVVAQTHKHRAIYMSENRGGEAINVGLQSATGALLHISENDLEYLPGWDQELLGKFSVFPELGQLSPFSPSPQNEKDKIWASHPSTSVTQGGRTICITDRNVTTSCLVRRSCWESGFHWHNLEKIEGSRFLFPDDGRASRDIQALGYQTAWNDKHAAVNWGHNIDEFLKNPEYYVSNYSSKPWLFLDGFRRRLNAHGYDLVETDKGRQIVKL